ncbi:MAG: hypothetical protein ACRDWN_00980 [Acidimicrobiales bacterium]
MRGVDDDEPGASIRQARIFSARYPAWGRSGLSGFIVRSEDEIIDLGADRLVRFPRLFAFELDVLVAAGFDVVPTFRSPHVTIVFKEPPEAAIVRLFGLPHLTITNPAFREEL